MNAPLASVTLEGNYTPTSGRAYLTDIEALVRLLLVQRQRDRAAGLNAGDFVSGYRGAPVGGLDRALWRAKKSLDAHNVVLHRGVNVELAMTSVRGTQEVTVVPGATVDGVYGRRYGEGPGLDRSMDALEPANVVGTST